MDFTGEITGWDDPVATLEEALREGRFVLLEQAIVPLKLDLAQSHCSAILLRHHEEADNRLPPGGFLPLAKGYGTMEQLDRWVVRTVMARCHEHQRRVPGWRAPLHWIKLSDSALRSMDFARAVARQIESEGFDGRLLCFELAERDVVGHPRQAQRLAETLKRPGCRIAVNAFGSVQPAFAELKVLAADFVKLDGTAIQSMLRNPAELARLRDANTVCQQLGVHTVAEFVDDAAMLAALRKIGVDYAQGFGVARPERLSGSVVAGGVAASG